MSDIERPKKGDKVMYSDEVWASASSQMRAFGRRAGVITRIFPDDHPWHANHASVRWGDSKNAAAWPIEIAKLVPADLVNAKDLKPPKAPKRPRGLSAWEQICWSTQGASL